MIRDLKRYPQALLQIGCLIVAVWFLAAGLLGANVMPVSIYGKAARFAPAQAWALSVIIPNIAFLFGFFWRRQLFIVLGAGAHFASMAALSMFILYAPGFSPIGPWSTMLTVTLGIMLYHNINDLLFYGEWYE